MGVEFIVDNLGDMCSLMCDNRIPDTIKYRGYTIERFMSGYTVFYNGDEVYFTTVTEAQEFIDSL